jgi:hypothetical protein
MPFEETGKEARRSCVHTVRSELVCAGPVAYEQHHH